jgi:glycosyltransferase involved in cell wall biosynthesis
VGDRFGPIPVHVAPLPSEMPDDLVPPLVPADQRRDFMLVGRLRPYKNAPVVFDAWRAFKQGHPDNDDRLIVMGHGDVAAGLPLGVEQHLGRYTFAEAAPRVAAAKASVSFYSRGSQSGAQIWSMQLGCAALVSNAGGLPEYQIPDLPCPDPDDRDGLAGLFARLADPAEAFLLGRDSQQDYRDRDSASISAAALVEIFRTVG